MQSVEGSPSSSSLTPEERNAQSSLMECLRKEIERAWIGPREALTILFCSKLDVVQAVKRYKKWVVMLKSYGFASLAEVLGPTASNALHGSGQEPPPAHWCDAPDWAELRADEDAHKNLLPAGYDGKGRQVMWQLGVMRCDRKREKVMLRVLTLLWLALHADLTTLREGVIVVHMVAPDDGSKLTKSSTRRLIGAAGSFPARPQKVLVAGLPPVGVNVAKTLIRLIFAVTRTKLLERINFVNYPTLWEHVPHRSIPKLEGVLRSGGAYAGTVHPIDWFEERIKGFDPGYADL